MPEGEDEEGLQKRDEGSKKINKLNSKIPK